MIQNSSREFAPQAYWPIFRQYPDLEIPSDWNSLSEFVDWYMGEGKPMLIPFDAPVVCTDDATAICLFRQGAYQVELYLIHPNYPIPAHSHPSMEVVTMTLGGGNAAGGRNALYGTSERCGSNDYLYEGKTHGGRKTEGGYAMLSFERWLDGVQPSSAALQWKGPTAGPIHDELLKKHKGVNGDLPS